MASDLFHFLQARIKKAALPGLASQIEMAPKPADSGAALRRMEPPPHTHASSVLLLIFPNKQRQYVIIITLRTDAINHGGQLSFPGGRAEAGEDSITAALREAKEEIGINPGDITIAGKLSELYVAHSNNNVTPVIGFLDYQPDLTINPDEVEEAFSVPLDSLLDGQNLTVEDWNLHDDAPFKVPYWDVHRVPLWGATAMILNEFLELYREFMKTQNSNDK